MSGEPQPRRGRFWATLIQFIKFGIVGGSGVVVNLIIAYVMTQLNGGVGNDNNVIFQLPGRFAFRFTILVWIVAFLVANLWNFQLNRSWTFKRDRMRGWWAEFWPFFLVGAVAAAAGAIIKVLLTNPTSPLYLPSPWFNDHQGLRARAYWAQLFTIVLTMPINYLVNKVWTFRAIKNKDADPDPTPHAEISGVA
ncbi:GtrA family protein [Propionimicrobium sp. PCR01-08-3]|uniref:GtrA family protein n=1 Tax=Propionimicrobium sp. PCR01-08-3 TaxID=3052086 RepID=UPI00255C71F2|nr:GtrA family protein [Propionimicrobium sp. PCR01-08-3]WIY81543.1 GtrA family protein [Propionimicrobium sp. PCR01-08-3]